MSSSADYESCSDSCAINLLNSVLGAGTSRRVMGIAKPAPVPPASHLSLLATLTIHPLHTTRVDKPDYLDVPSQALDYLRNLLALVGPLNADFRTAFQFHHTARWNRRGGYHSHGNNSDASEGDEDRDEDRLSGRLANQGSLWNRGQDFWSTLGWAFNCSTLYPHRWRYWKVWLEFMLDVLESDWNERERLDLEAHQAQGNAGDAPLTSRRESIISMYMDQQSGRRGSFKVIIKALLADGSSISSTSFREVFDKEPRGRKKESKKRKREALDLENDKFGDYFDDDSISSGASEPPTPQKPRDQRKKTSFGSSHPGLVESIHLRLRLFKLLSLATYTLSQPRELHELYDEFSAAIKLLPLELFSLFVSQRTNPLLPETHVTILKELFRLLLPASHKDPGKVDPDGEATGSLSSLMLERCFVLHPANTAAIEDNAKLSLVVESAIQLLWKCDSITYTDDFMGAVEKGIAARETKTKKKRTGRGKTDPGDALAQEVLSNSADRLRLLLGALEATAEAET